MRRNRRHLYRDVPWGGSNRYHFTFFSNLNMAGQQEIM